MSRLKAKNEKPRLQKFWKIQSEGNDFIVLSGEGAQRYKKPKEIKRLCNRVFGIGANGAIFMNKTPKGWAWNFFNEDGSTAGMCGNGAKCAALWMSKYGEPRKKTWSWRSAIGVAQGKVDAAKLTWVQWPIANTKPHQGIVSELGEILDGLNERGLAYIAFIDAGIPHLVLVNHESWTPTERSTLNEQLRHHPAFGKPGTNVTWHSLGTGESVTYERGVEAETLACGTGAIAIYKALEDMGRAKGKAALKFPGGVLYATRDKSTGEYWLGGKPVEVFSGQF